MEVESMDVGCLVEVINSKLDCARLLDYNFKCKNYKWVLGIKSYEALLHECQKRNIGVYFDRYTIDDYRLSMNGIVIDHIDTDRPHRIMLFKEVSYND